MKTVDKLLNDGTRYCYWLDKTQPDQQYPDRFRVSLVFENESGYRPTGGGDVVPWYWDVKTCKEQNARLGLTTTDVNNIILSSMFI